MNQRRSLAIRMTALTPLLAALALINPSGAQDQVDVRAAYTKSEHRISMRDGVKLFTSVYSPRDTSQRFPIMLIRTPYSVAPYASDAYKATLGPSPLFTKEGYIFVVPEGPQDHGADSKHLVPIGRSESPEVREHLQCDAGRLSESDRASLSLAAIQLSAESVRA